MANDRTNREERQAEDLAEVERHLSAAAAYMTQAENRAGLMGDRAHRRTLADEGDRLAEMRRTVAKIQSEGRPAA